MNAVAKKEAKAAKPAKAKAEKKSTSKGGVVDARLYDVIVRPLITEKATQQSEQNKVTFKISPTANKKDVKDAVEAIFGVKVKSVNTINVEGKEKKFRGNIGFRKDFRKAIVTLEPGQNIDVAAGQR